MSFLNDFFTVRNWQIVTLTFAILLVCSQCFWNPSDEKRAMYENGSASPYHEFNYFINSFLLSEKFMKGMEVRFGQEAGFYLCLYIRDLVLGMVVYYSVASLWHVWLYKWRGKEIFDDQGRERPSWPTIWDQIQLAQCSIFLYALLPVLSTYLVEKGYTKSYFYLDEIGGIVPYLGYLVVYIVFVEVCIYWIHRQLHTDKFLYKFPL